MADGMLKVGDVVKLKSGSPAMTVETAGSQESRTVWFDGSKRHDGLFPNETLEKYDPDDLSGLF